MATRPTSRLAANRGRGRRPGVGRALHPDPDHIVEARAATCPSCAAALAEGDQKLQAVFERIELPPIKPIVTQVRLHGGTCPHCGEAFTAPPPGLEPGSPFGPSIEALAVYLHHCQAIGFERLSALFRDIFGVPISEGALANLFKRVKPRFDEQATAIKQRVLDSPIVCSDEDLGPGGGAELVGMGLPRQRCRPPRHRAQPGQEGAAGDLRRPPARGLGFRPARRPSRGHAEDWQVCLAHQLRNVQYAIDAGDDILSPMMKRLLLRAIAIGKRRDRLKVGTLLQYRADLERRMDAIMKLPPTNRHGIRLRKRFAKIRSNLFVFVTDRDVPYTNNASERALRPSVVFRKVTNGFRSQWGGQLFAAVRSVVDTRPPKPPLRLPSHPRNSRRKLHLHASVALPG